MALSIHYDFIKQYNYNLYFVILNCKTFAPIQKTAIEGDIALFPSVACAMTTLKSNCVMEKYVLCHL